VLAALRFSDQNYRGAALQIGVSEEQFRALLVEMKMAPDLEPASQEVLPRMVRDS